MTKRRNTDHVVINYAVQPPVFECRHCGARESISLPQRISVFLLRAEAFTLEHRDCKAPPDGETARLAKIVDGLMDGARWLAERSEDEP